MIARWKIQNQILLLVAILVVPMLGMLLLSAVERAQVNRIEQGERIQALTNLTAARLDQMAIDSRDLLGVLTQLPVLKRLDRLSCDGVVSTLDFDANVYANAVIFDHDGRLICSSAPPAETAPGSALGHDWFKAAISRPGFQISGPYVDRISRTWAVMFSSPIRDVDGEVSGILGLPVSLEELGLQMTSQPVPDGQVLTVLDADGRVIVRSPDAGPWLGKDVSRNPLFMRPGLEGELIEKVGLDQVRRFYANQTASLPGWRVNVGIPVEYVHGPAEQQLAKGVWMLIIITLIAVALAIAMTRVILRPLRQLVADIDSQSSETELSSAIGQGSPEIRSIAVELISAIATRKVAEQRKLLLAKVLESSNEAIFMTDSDNRITAVNHAFETITGYPEAEVLGSNPSVLRSGRHDRDFFRSLWASLEATGAWQGEVWNRRKSGEVFPSIQAISRVFDDAGEVCYVALMLDISRQNEIELELEHLAQHDPLTGLSNRAVFLRSLELAVARNRRLKDQHVAILCLDVDAFKDVNDTLGHPAGDELLVQISHRLATCFDAGESIFRIGGDEFMVIVEGIAHQDALVPIIAMIQKTMEPAFVLGEQEVSITMSLGISLHPDHADKVTELVSFADAATYRAKREGRGGYAFYTEDMTRDAERRLSLEHALRRALIQQEQFFLVYQPQMSLRDGSIVGCEALIRWNHPVRGLLMPMEFIALAEQTGLIEKVTEWVVDEVCRQIRAWQDRLGDVPPVAVNLSGQHLGSGKFADYLQRTLTKHGVAPDRIDVEITESTLMADPGPARIEIDRLRALGCRVSIDDFGTGYSSLSYLKQFNADVLKIDRSFVSLVDQDASNQSIARAVIAVGHALNMQVLAEGVEQLAEQQWLQGAGCDLTQGYYFCKPVSAEEYLGFVEALR